MSEGTFALIEQAQAGDKGASERLIEENNGLIWSIARRYFGRGVDPDDLYQLGCLGFLKAVAGFDPAFGTQFSTYAVPKISGEIRRFLRDDGTVKVSRTIKERSAAIKQAREKLIAKNGMEPTLTELAEFSGFTVDEIAVAETATAATESIQRPTGEDGLTLEQMLTEGSPEETMVEHLTLHQALSALPERERNVIALRYFHALTQQKCAQVLGVSQVQISRIEKKAIEMLRAYF